MPIRINGATSGYVELAAPAVAGSTSLTMPATSGTVPVLASGSASGESSSLKINTRPWNMPWGIVAYSVLTTSFSTSGTHTSPQDTGASISVPLVTGRIYKFTQVGNPYNPGSASAGVMFQITDSSGSSVYAAFNIDSQAMLPGASLAVTNVALHTAVVTGSTTFKVRMYAVGVNATVSDYGSSTQSRLFFAEDVGPA